MKNETDDQIEEINKQNKKTYEEVSQITHSINNQVEELWQEIR